MNKLNWIFLHFGDPKISNNSFRENFLILNFFNVMFTINKLADFNFLF